MELEKYFIKDKKNSAEAIMKIYNELNENVSKYISDEKPILNGNIVKYNEIIGNKHLSDSPKNTSQLLKEFSRLFQKSVVWENPGTMINITPPANIVSIVTSLYTSLYNPNFAQDESSGYLMATELIVSKYLSELVGWNSSKSRGIFTFGGKGTNLYAVKIGIKKTFPNVIDEGIKDKDIIVISNDKSHPCHKEVCDWLGLGKNACLRLSTDKNGQINIEELESILRKNIIENKKIGCIILNGGTTNEIIVDPIKKVVDLRDKLVKEYNLDYKPHIHVDAVIGWAWLFFKSYDFEKNTLNMSREEIKKIKSMNKKISQIYYADSFGADFHKTGFCPYVSSIYMSKNFGEVSALGNKIDQGIDNMTFGEYSPFEYTLELTRSSIGPVAAYTTLETFGISGFQELIYNVFSNGEYIREVLSSKNNFEVINMNTEGIATLFVITPPGDKKTYKDYLSCDVEERRKFLDYNHQFYLYCLKKIEENKINFKITFSKSYKPFGCNFATGALKIYQTSPLTTKLELDKIINEIIDLKIEYDDCNEVLYEKREVPIDYVYRD